MNRALAVFVAPVVVALAITVPVMLSINSTQVATQNRLTQVVACEAANRTHDGVEKLVGQLEKQTALGRLTPTQKAAAIASYQGLLADFPRLDCTANPINFQG